MKAAASNPLGSEQDLFDRVQAKVNKEPLKAVLVEYQQQHPGEISTSGVKADLIGHLRDACSIGRIPRERVFALLQEYEENGNQTGLLLLAEDRGSSPDL